MCQDNQRFGRTKLVRNLDGIHQPHQMDLAKAAGRILSFLTIIAVFNGVLFNPVASASDYVWARNNWGASPIGRNYGGMGNGYGGYYVPRNAYGNNYETRRPFTNPNGFIVPAETAKCPAPQQTSAPTLAASSVVPTQPIQAQQPAIGAATSRLQPYRLTPIAK